MKLYNAHVIDQQESVRDALVKLNQLGIKHIKL